MSNLLDEIDEHQDHEVTLGTGALLGIFFAVVLICAVFFGLGYSLGRRSGEPATGAKTHSAAGKSTAAEPATNSSLDSDLTDKPSPTTESESPAKPVTHSVIKNAPPIDAPLAVVSKPAVVKQSSTPNANATAAPASGGQTMVQLMAAAQSEDAEVLATALRKRGYHAIVRNEPDHLYHVQVGPFPSRTEADTMRRKLQADGYNAILK